jgi:hypothetical protein
LKNLHLPEASFAILVRNEDILIETRSSSLEVTLFPPSLSLAVYAILIPGQCIEDRNNKQAQRTIRKRRISSVTADSFIRHHRQPSRCPSKQCIPFFLSCSFLLPRFYTTNRSPTWCFLIAFESEASIFLQRPASLSCQTLVLFWAPSRNHQHVKHLSRFCALSVLLLPTPLGGSLRNLLLSPFSSAPLLPVSSSTNPLL